MLLVPILCFAQFDPLAVEAGADSLNCNGDANGELYWQITGGESPYFYEWSRLTNAFVFASGEQSADGLAGPVGGALEANVFIISITDAAGTVAMDTIEIAEPPAIQVTSIEVDPTSCADTCDGLINMELIGGTGLLLTSWNDGSEMGAFRPGLCPGSYVFFVEDERGCSQKGLIDIFSPEPLEVNAELTIPSCTGAANGAIAVVPEGGTGEYTYLWETGDTQPLLSSISSDTYGLTITDDNNCQLFEDISLVDGPSMFSNIQINYGCGDGQIVVSTQPVNGSSPFVYDWSTGQSNPYLFGLSSGTYGLHLQDANGCEDIVEFEVDFVPPLMIDAFVEDVTCPGAQDGSVDLEVSGGLPPYSLVWSTGEDAMSILNLEGGEYFYNLNAGGCGVARSVIVEEPQELNVQILYDAQSDGLLSATALLSGGTAPYQLNWSNGSSSTLSTDLDPELTYTLTVTDASFCVSEFQLNPSLTATEAPLAESINIFPNPSFGSFSLQTFFDQDESSQFRLLDLKGSVLINWQAINHTLETIDISAFPAGLYLLQINTGTSWHVERLVKL